MRRTLLFALSLLAVVACSKFDDSEIWSELKEHEDRIVKLETLCNQMNTNITSLQTIIIALQNNDYVTNIAPIKEGSKEIGYTITFAKSGSITIYHGKDGENGKDGQNGTNGTDGKDGQDGKDGKDGYTPKIGVKQHTDGQYYWTLDGNWLLDDNGHMIPTTGEDGKNGQDGEDGKDGTNGTDGTDGKDGVDGKDGQDGITPQLKIEDGYWYLSYDNGATWQKLGKATGNNGLDGANGADGEDGDSIIDSITQDEENVYFNLSDGSLITLPKRNVDTIVFEDLNVKAICCKNWDTNHDGELSYSEAAAVLSIDGVFSNSSSEGNPNIIAFNELKYFTGITTIPAYAFYKCSNLWKITIPNTVSIIDRYAFNGCSNLSYLQIPEDAQLSIIDSDALSGCSGLLSISLPTSLTAIGDRAFSDCSSLVTLHIPDNVNTIGSYTFTGCKSLELLYIGKGVNIIGNNALSGLTCHLIYNSVVPDVTGSGSKAGIFSETSFVKVTFGGNATKIGAHAFDKYWSDGYTTSMTVTSSINIVIIKETVKELGEYAFNVTGLESIYCEAQIPPKGSRSMFDSDELNKIYVPIGTAELYKTATYWKNYASKIEEYDFVNNPIN